MSPKPLRELELRLDVVGQRDDLSVDSALYKQTGQHAKALELVAGRNFQPWKGAKGSLWGNLSATISALGRQALHSGDAAQVLEHFQTAATAGRNLGESKHLLANQSDTRAWTVRIALEA